MGENTAGKSAGLLRKAVHRFSASDAEVEAKSLQNQAQRLGATPIASADDRQMVSVAGTVRSLTLRPVGGVPALEADLYDGSGAVTLIFLGRRHVAGIHPGRTLTARGRICKVNRRPVIFNPNYTLLSPGKHA